MDRFSNLILNISMYIELETITPNGATATIHRVHSISIVNESVAVTINSYANDEATLPLWQDGYAMPMAAFTASVYPQCLRDWLITDAFPDGVIVDPEETP